MRTKTSCKCPLCNFEDERTKVYQHLQTSHRKSELSRKILADENEAADWIGEKYCETGNAD